jgi:hypothetical protein
MKIIIDTYPNIKRETTGHRVTLTLIDGSIITIDEPVNVNKGLRIDVNGPIEVYVAKDTGSILIER